MDTTNEVLVLLAMRGAGTICTKWNQSQMKESKDERDDILHV